MTFRADTIITDSDGEADGTMHDIIRGAARSFLAMAESAEIINVVLLEKQEALVGILQRIGELEQHLEKPQ